MPRGTDFTARWSEGAWAEERIAEAINREPEFIAVQYGITDGEAFWSVGEMEARNLPDQWRHGKRPDILVFERSRLSEEEQGLIRKVCELDDTDCEDLVRKASFAIESEFSPYDYAHRLKEYGKHLSFTVKEEDLQPTANWRKHFRIEVGIVQLFLDSAHMLTVGQLLAGIADKSIPRTIERSYNKPVYYTPMHRGEVFGDFEERPSITAEMILDKYGKYTPFRRVGGGLLQLTDPTRRRLHRKQ